MSERGIVQKGGNFCDLDYLLVNLGRNQATAERLIQIFLDNVPTLCQRLDDAATQGDLVALKDVLHDIRSSCVLFSGHQCVDLARDIEHALREAISSTDGTLIRDWRLMTVPLHTCLECMAGELRFYLAQRAV